MKPFAFQLLCLSAVVLVALALVALIVTAPKNPVALIRVVDASGKPVVGATVLPQGLRTKAGPYRSGWYGWGTAITNRVPNSPVRTDKNGFARMPYPTYVFERIETGTLCLGVSHPDFVPDRPECVVATALPAGAPWRARVQDLWDRIRHRALLARPDSVMLQKGAILRVTVPIDSASPQPTRLFAQVSGQTSGDTDFWSRPEPGVMVTRRLGAGPHSVRAVQLDSAGSAWFSDLVSITAATGQTNELMAHLKPGAAVRGKLDDSVPRPVKQGRVVAHVWPQGSKPQENPPQWHAWAGVQEDGSFTISSLPEGDLEIVSLCDGFVSTNGPGQSNMHYPQKHLLGTNDLVLVIGMEPTARLEVNVTDEAGHPLKDVRVMTWPNVRYGEWSATILLGDCYNTLDHLQAEPGNNFSWGQPGLDFQGVSDGTGLAVLPNLPVETKELAVEHSQFTLPTITTPDGRKHRQASFTLVAGQTNRLSLQLEPRERSTITHY